MQRPPLSKHLIHARRPGITLLIQTQPRIPPTILALIPRALVIAQRQTRNSRLGRAGGRKRVAAPALAAPLRSGVLVAARGAEGRARLVGVGVGRLDRAREGAERAVRRPALFGGAA